MIFIDSNIPMYLIGQDHPHKRDALVLLEKLVSEKQSLVTNTGVFQEILHRYVSINRREAIQPAFDLLYDLVDEIFEIQEKDVGEAKTLVLAYPKLSARDAIHVSMLKRLHILRIISFDKGFDQVPGFERLP